MTKEQYFQTVLLSISCARTQQFLLDKIKETGYYKKNVKLKQVGAQFNTLLANNIGFSYKSLIFDSEPDNEIAFNNITNTLEFLIDTIISTPFENQQELGDLIKEFIERSKIESYLGKVN